MSKANVEQVVRRQFTEGAPNKAGSYWLRLSPTKKMIDAGLSYNLTCYGAMCDCHKVFHRMDELDKKRLDKGYYTVTGYIELPDA